MSGAASLLAVLLLAAGADVSWLVDEDIPVRAAAARADAAAIDAKVTDTLRLRDGVLARRKNALEEKAALEQGLPELKRGAKEDAEKKIAELASAIAGDDRRLRELDAQIASLRKSAQDRRAFATAADEELRRRIADADKSALPADADLTTYPDARLREAIAFRERRLARVPQQLEVLDRELYAAVSTTDRAAVMAKKEAVRQGAAFDRAEIVRLTDELRFREDAKHDEEVLARQFEQAAIAKASERQTETPSPTPGKDERDAMLDRILEAEDRRAAEDAARAKSAVRTKRIAVAIAGFGVLAGILVVALRRMG